MKKGCFITVIVTLCLLILAVFYLIRFHGEELLEKGTEKLVELTQAKIVTDISNLDDNSYVDSLKVLVDNYFKQIKGSNIVTELERIEELADDFEVILMDSRIDSAEFDFIKNRLRYYEQRKEN